MTRRGLIKNIHSQVLGLGKTVAAVGGIGLDLAAHCDRIGQAARRSHQGLAGFDGLVGGGLDCAVKIERRQPRRGLIKGREVDSLEGEVIDREGLLGLGLRGCGGLRWPRRSHREGRIAIGRSDGSGEIIQEAKTLDLVDIPRQYLIDFGANCLGEAVIRHRISDCEGKDSQAAQSAELLGLDDTDGKVAVAAQQDEVDNLRLLTQAESDRR